VSKLEELRKKLAQRVHVETALTIRYSAASENTRSATLK